MVHLCHSCFFGVRLEHKHSYMEENYDGSKHFSFVFQVILWFLSDSTVHERTTRCTSLLSTLWEETVCLRKMTYRQDP